MNFGRLFFPLLLIITIFFFSCTVSTTKTFDPAFKTSTDSLSRLINTIAYSPETVIHGKRTKTNGKVTTEMIINLINTQNLPAETSEQKILGLHIASLLKYALKDTGTFTDYQVMFTRRITEGGITKSDYTGYPYKSYELKNHIEVVSVGDTFDSNFTLQAMGKTDFTRNDTTIIVALKYYNNIAGLPISLKVYKQTDSGKLLVETVPVGVTRLVGDYTYTTLKPAGFYEREQLGAGAYKIEYLFSDTVVGEKPFKLL